MDNNITLQDFLVEINDAIFELNESIIKNGTDGFLEDQKKELMTTRQLIISRLGGNKP